MALQTMNVSSTAVTGDVEILYHSNYTGEAVTLDTTAFSDGVCKAGTPLPPTARLIPMVLPSWASCCMM